MGDFLNEIKPRNLLYLNHPEKHLTLRQFTVAVLMMALSAAFWGYVTGSRLVVLFIASGQMVTIWRTPAAAEKPWLRFHAAFVFGALTAAAWLILKRLGLSR